MKRLEQQIQLYGQVPNEDVLKVDAFLNHQIDPMLMMELAKDFQDHFKDVKIDKIVTIETSGIAPSVFLGYVLQVPIVYMKKAASKILSDDYYHTQIHSFTKNLDYDIMVSKRYLTAGEHVLFLDDFMANGEACLGALQILKQADVHVSGIGIVIEKAFQSGRKRVEALGYSVYAQARIASLKDKQIQFVD